MTEPAAPEAAGVSEARSLRREYMLAHVSLALLLGLGSLAGWRAAEAIGASGPQGIKTFDSETGMRKSTSDANADVNEERERALVTRLDKENADWFYDAQGNATKEGEAVRHYIEEARRLGLKGAQARWDYAVAMVERDLLKQWMEKNRQPADSGQQAPEARHAPPPLP